MIGHRFLLLSAVLASSAFACGQDTLTTASVTGRVLDPSGAAVAQAMVVAQELTTNQSRTVQTDGEGRFHVPFLAVGAYRFTTHPAGFAETTRDIQLTVGAAFDLTLPVSIGQTNTSVRVAAESLVLEENRSQISETVLQTEVNNLPFNGRNYLDLALLAPGVSPTNTASIQTFAETSPVVGQGYSVNSQRNFSNSFVVDGLSANDDAAGLAGNSYSMDVVREFQVVTSGGQAEFGRAMGGYFNLVTRSGANDLHGTVYGFLRNQRLNSANALSRSRLPLTQGQYGASLSGPIKRDRTFLFGNYEGRRLNTDGIVTISPANAASINQRLDAVNFSGPRLVTGGPTTFYPTTVHADTAFVRADHQLSEHDQVSLRYSYYRLNSINARGTGGLADVSYGTAVRDENHTVAVSNVATLSPRIFNETRGQFTYDSLNAPPNTLTSPAITISGVATFGRFSSSPTARLNYLAELVDNLVLQRGAHAIKTGVDFLYNDDTITFPQTIAGSYTFSSLANFNKGVYNTGGFSQSFGIPFVQQNNPNVGFYAQDEWKMAPSFTLNLGVRYDLQFLQTIHTDPHNVSPRIGFSWAPNRVRTTVVRGSYGLFYDRVPLRALANALLSANNTADASQGRLLSYTYSPTTTGAPVFPETASTPPPGALLNYTLMNRNIQNAYSQQASLGVEQQLFSRGTLGISYQHVRGLHLLSSYNANINLDGTRPDPTRGNIKPYDSRFDSYYDGLAVSFLERPVSWGSARVSYTWSKAIDDVGQFFFSAPINNFDFGVDRARSDDDQRHRLVFDASVQSPTTHASGLAEQVTHGWRLGGILQYYSALPFNIVTGASTLQQTTARPCTVAFYGNAACSEGIRGSVIGRNAGTGFDFVTLNARLSRTLALTERVKLEVMAEAFNALNHRNNAIPNGTFGTGRIDLAPTNSSFGRATAVNDPRSVQLAARINF
jgi:Carboxypeptidase regulatory-like domain/TonB dependent receptor-like, beta-barrel